MAKSSNRLANVPVNGTSFKFQPGQSVHVIVDGADDIYTGSVIECGSLASESTNLYRVRLVSGVYSLYNENQLIGRQWSLFDKMGKELEGHRYNSEADAINAEEDFSYDSLEAQLPTNQLVALEIEVWEINEKGGRMEKIVLE